MPVARADSPLRLPLPSLKTGTLINANSRLSAFRPPELYQIRPVAGVTVHGDRVRCSPGENGTVPFGGEGREGNVLGRCDPRISVDAKEKELILKIYEVLLIISFH